MKKRVMIVDDAEDFLFMLREYLTDTFEVTAFKDGSDALCECRVNPPDIVITDLVMPKMNGIELIIAMNQEQIKLPIIAISGGGGITGRFDYLPIASLVGANAIMKKPFSLNDLRNRIRECLEV